MSWREIDPWQVSAAWWERFHHYRGLRQAESKPEETLMPEPLVEKEMRRENKLRFQRFFVAEEAGAIVGYLQASASKKEAPDYESNKHILRVSVGSLKEHRLATSDWVGVGKVLLAEYGCKVLTTASDEAEVQQEMERLGFRAVLREYENRLDLEAVDWAQVRSWVQEGQVRNPQTHLRRYERRVPVERLGEYSRALTEIFNAMPHEAMDIGQRVITPETMETWYAELADTKSAVHAMVTEEVDGRISGITQMIEHSWQTERTEQGITGVCHVDRGRGLGKWLKAAMLEYVHEHHLAARWVVTGNAHSNDPMLHINNALGFRTYAENVIYQMNSEELSAMLEKTTEAFSC